MIVFELLAGGHEVVDEFVQILLELLLDHVLDRVKEQQPVRLVDQAVVEHAVDLVHPQPDQLVALVHVRGRHEQHAEDHAREVAQVEHVVRLGGGGQEAVDGRLVHVHGRLNEDLRHTKGGRSVPGVPVD